MFLRLRLAWSVTVLLTAAAVVLLMPVNDKTPPAPEVGTGGVVFVLDGAR